MSCARELHHSERPCVASMRRSMARSPSRVASTSPNSSSAVLDRKGAVGAVADDPGDGVSVHAPPRQCAENEDVESALEEVELGGHLTIIPSTVDTIKC